MAFLNGESGPTMGFTLLRVCPEVLKFWESSKDKSGLSDILKSQGACVSTLDGQLFTTTNTWTKVAPYAILQTTSSELSDELNIAEKIFIVAQNVNADPYMKYVGEEIIPFIYQIQEILIRSHQQAKRASQI